MTTYTFSPWAVRDGRRVVAPEAEWKAVERMENAACRDIAAWVDSGGMNRGDPKPEPPVVRIGVDLFEPFSGEYWNESTPENFEHEICVCHGCGKWMSFMSR